MELSDIILLSSPLIGIGVLLSITIGALVYMLSKLLGDQNIEQKGKLFLVSSIETLLIIAFFILMSEILSFLFSSSIGCSPNADSCSPVYFAKISLTRVVDVLVSLYFTFYAFDVVVGPFIQSVITTPVITGGPASFQISVMPLVGLDLIMEFYYTVMQRIVDMLIFVLARSMIIEIAIPLSAFLLPFAVALRSLPPTKRVGSSILALILVIYYVFPLSVLFSDYLMFQQYKTDLINPDSSLSQEFIPDYVKEDVKTEESPGDLEKTYSELIKAYQTEPLEDPNTPEVDPFTIEEALDRLWGGPLTILEGKATSMIFASLLASLGSLIVNYFPSFGAAKLAGLFANIWWVKEALENLNPIEWQGYLLYSSIYLIIVVSQIITLVLITFIFEILISITAYRAIAKVIGGDVSLLGLTKVI